MRFCIKALTAGIFTVASFSSGASAAPASDVTPQMAYEDISRSLAELEPVTTIACSFITAQSQNHHT